MARAMKTSRLLSLTVHVLRLRDSGAQTQGEGDEEQSHPGERLSLPRLRGDGGRGLGERKTTQRAVTVIITTAVWRKVLRSCALAGLQKCARGFACLACTSSVVKSSWVIKSAPRHLDSRASLSLSGCVCVCVRGAGVLWLAVAPACAAVSPARLLPQWCDVVGRATCVRVLPD